MFAFGIVAAIAFLVGVLTMDRMYAHRFGWLIKASPLYNKDRKVMDAMDWATLATGDSGWPEIEKAWLRKAQELYALFCSKQADYGPTNIGVGGEQGITIRLGDKISRLFELLHLTDRENGGAPANEAVRDTWADIGDYGIIGMIVHDGEWPLVDPTQVWGAEAAQKLLLELVKSNPLVLETVMTELAEFGVARLMAEDLGARVI